VVSHCCEALQHDRAVNSSPKPRASLFSDSDRTASLRNTLDALSSSSHTPIVASTRLVTAFCPAAALQLDSGRSLYLPSSDEQLVPNKVLPWVS
jgi:hypothetical protein